MRIVEVVGVGARHDEVDGGQGVAQTGGEAYVGEGREPTHAALEIVEVHEVRAGAEVAAAAAQTQGLGAVAPVDGHGGRRGRARALDQAGGQAHEVLTFDLGAGGAQQRQGLALVHPHADGRADLEGGVIDGPLVVVA